MIVFNVIATVSLLDLRIPAARMTIPVVRNAKTQGVQIMSKDKTIQGYGLTARLLHWVMAGQVLGMFALGYWMRTLDYYSPWYQRAPELHKSFGVIFLVLVIARVFWRLTHHQPPALAHNVFERRIAQVAHFALYALLLAMVITGLLFATGDGKPLSAFGLFELPSLFKNKPVADFAGDVHQWLAYSILGLAFVHMAGALKHHFIDRDDTLRRMVRAVPATSVSQSQPQSQHQSLPQTTPQPSKE